MAEKSYKGGGVILKGIWVDFFQKPYKGGGPYCLLRVISFDMRSLHISEHFKSFRCAVPCVQVPFTPLAKPTGTPCICAIYLGLK